MKKVMAILGLLIVLAAFSVAQQPAAAPAGAPQTQTSPSSPIPDGTTMHVELKNDIDTRKAKVGDAVRLEVMEDAKNPEGRAMLGPDGKPVVPKKTQLNARVAAVKASTKESKDAKLSLLVTSATFPNGQTFLILGLMIGPFTPLKPLTGEVTLGSGWDASKGLTDTVGGAPSGLNGVTLKQDQQFGSALVSDKQNIVLDKGVQFYIRRVVPTTPAAAPAQPPSQ